MLLNNPGPNFLSDSRECCFCLAMIITPLNVSGGFFSFLISASCRLGFLLFAVEDHRGRLGQASVGRGEGRGRRAMWRAAREEGRFEIAGCLTCSTYVGERI